MWPLWPVSFPQPNTSRCIHVVACVSILFFFMAEWYYIIWMTRVLFVHSAAGDLGCLHGFSCYEEYCYRHSCTSFWLSMFSFLWGRYLGITLPNRMVTIWIPTRLFSKTDAPFFHSHQQWVPNFPHPCQYLLLSIFFFLFQPFWCGVYFWFLTSFWKVI